MAEGNGAGAGDQLGKLVVLVGPSGPELRALKRALEAAGLVVRRAATLASAAKKVGTGGIVLEATLVVTPRELSRREREVKNLVQLGLGSREIADALAISESSVKVFRQRGSMKTRRRQARRLVDR